METALDQPTLVIGVDVGGTFTDLVAVDTSTGRMTIVKVPSTPPDFETAVVQAVGRVGRFGRLIHGSTVATNALLERRGEPIAFITNEGFRDMLLIGRQNRPSLYALHVRRPRPITPPENWFTVRGRIDTAGVVVTPLEIGRLVEDVNRRGLKHAAVCLLFSFANPEQERAVGAALEGVGVTVSLSSDVLPEFREYERASTTAINASLRPTVESYLGRLATRIREFSGYQLPVADDGSARPATSNSQPTTYDVQIMHGGGGTLPIADAARSAARLVLSGSAGGVIGAAFVASVAGLSDVITYDMGGTSTDVAVVKGGMPQWSTSAVIDGLPIGLPAFDIHTVGAGGGSIAYVDAGGALRVGPRSAGANPGPACYGRGGLDPTVTDANVVLGRILADRFLGGQLVVHIDRAVAAIEPLARRIDKSVIDTALGVVKVAEANMASAVRAVTSRRGHDPRRFALVSFGGAGGLHACAIADTLEIPTVLIPPHCGVLSALGMVVARPTTDVSRAVVQLPSLDNETLARLFTQMEQSLPPGSTERFADVRFKGQSYELKVPVNPISMASIEDTFKIAYADLYGTLPAGRVIEPVTLRVRRTGDGVDITLPPVDPDPSPPRPVPVVDPTGTHVTALAMSRGQLLAHGQTDGPLLLIDPTATAFIPAGRTASSSADGTVFAHR